MSSPKFMRSVIATCRTRSGPLLRVLVLGQPGVGKTALTVRFITKRFIGEYDPTLEKKYIFQTELDNSIMTFEIMDTAGQVENTTQVEEHIRWADAFILVYSITDLCSFEECTRLKFLINHVKSKSRNFISTAFTSTLDPPVVLVGNMNDMSHERMISLEGGRKRSEEIGCSMCFDISVRESYSEVKAIFEHLVYHMRNPPLKSPQSLEPGTPLSLSGRRGSSVIGLEVNPLALSPAASPSRQEDIWNSFAISESPPSRKAGSPVSPADGTFAVPKASMPGRLIRRVLRGRRHRDSEHSTVSLSSRSDSDSSQESFLAGQVPAC